MSENFRCCPSCGLVLPANAPDGICPRCLLQNALGSEVHEPDIPEVSISFEPGRTSVFTELAESIGGIPHVLLRDTDLGEEPSPVVKPSSSELPGAADRSGRYQFLGEIARGGMGAVLRGRDSELGRDLAIKVLLESHREKPELIRRFVEEAQIGGQLQHPGIVPIYDVGTFADLRPFFTMKLVKGQTLSSLLRGRKSPVDGLSRFLSIYEQVCQTMAYAHTRGVIHRDLKPSNVMVGNFGEVQVMDWGLAKVLPRGGVADDEIVPSQPEVSVIHTARSGSGEDASEVGSVLGTPSYMAPEQARGELDRVGERADVFGLGSMLCEILTGQAAFTGRTSGEVMRKAARGELGEAFARLDDSGAEPDLIALVKQCLAPELEDRPRNARDVSDSMTNHLAGVQERLRQTELARVEANARAAEERKRRKLTVALAASIVGTILLGGGGWYSNERQKRERAVRVDLALREAEVLHDQAKQAGDDLARWSAARDAAHAVERLLADARDQTTRQRVTDFAQSVTAVATAAENDQKLLSKLIDIRSANGDDPDGSASDAAYADAFREAGVDLATLPPAEAGARIKARPATVAVPLAAALDHWAAVRRGRRLNQGGAERLAQAARNADPEPWRNRLRDALDSPDKQKRLDTLRALAGSAKVDELPPVSLNLLGAALFGAGDPERAESVLRQAQRQYPGDVWLNYNLALCLQHLARREEAIRYYIAARTIRPETAHELAHALGANGESDESIAVFRDLARLRPANGRHLGCLGRALQAIGRSQEANAALDAAIVALRDDIRRKRHDLVAHNSLGYALAAQGKHEEAIAEYREAIRLKPDNAWAHTNLGNALGSQGKQEEAIAEYREAIRLKPDYAGAHTNLGNALGSQGRQEEAIVECREVIRLKPELPGAHFNLGLALWALGKKDEAIAEYREAIRLKPNDAGAHTNLGNALGSQGKQEEAIVECREVIRLKPDLPGAHFNLGLALWALGKKDEAITAFREAIRLESDYAEAHCNLGQILRQQGRYSEALAALRRGHELGTDRPNWRYPSGQNVRDCERLVALDAKLPAILRGEAQPANAAERLTLAEMCHDKELRGAEARFWSEAFHADPNLADDMQAQSRYRAACSAVLGGCGNSKDDPPLSETARARLRQQALNWLKADLAFWAKQVDRGSAQSNVSVKQTLQHWKTDPDLAGIRDHEALNRLHEEEKKALSAFWIEVNSMIKRASTRGPQG